ncbi:MAG: hypothetical protein Q8K10_15560, partial [Methylobacter sp.]|nr:hypothetical protein [Methylobacter sp.]
RHSMTENLSTNSVFDRHYQDVDDRGNFVAVLYYFLPFPLFPFYITIVAFYMRYRVTFWEFEPCPKTAIFG